MEIAELVSPSDKLGCDATRKTAVVGGEDEDYGCVRVLVCVRVRVCV